MEIGVAFPRREGRAYPATAAKETSSEQRRVPVGWLLPSLVDLFVVICLFVALKSGDVMLSADGDPSRHLAVGNWIVSNGAIPDRDVFSHTMAGQPFVPYEWLAETASALTYRWIGLAGPVLLHGAIIGLTFAVLYRQLRGRGHPLLLAAAVALLALSVSTVHWLARPHVFTFLGTALFSAVLDGRHAARLSRRWLWLLPPVMALWANIHGGFLIGVILLGAYAGADVLRWLAADVDSAAAARARLRALLLPGLATVVAPLANPAGIGLLPHVTGYLGKKLLVDITQEYQSPSFHDADIRLFVVMLFGTLASLIWSRRRPALHEAFLFLGFTYFALYAGRNVPLFAIVVAPILAAQLQAIGVETRFSVRPSPLLAGVAAWRRRRNNRYTRLDGAALGFVWPAVALALLVSVAAAQHRAGVAPLGVDFDPKKQPVAAAAYLKEHLPAGNGFNTLGWGGYLLHQLWPHQRVFIDGQTDFYGEDLTREYLQVIGLSENWREILAKYDVRWAIYATDSPLVRALAATPGWRTAYRDKLATVLVND